MTDSWWLKLQRADHHLEEVQRLVTAYEGKHAYRAVRVPPSKSKPSDWRYILETTEAPDENLPIVIGDVIHNMRSALDHILAAIRPPKHRYKKGFPILVENPWKAPFTKAKLADQQAFCESVTGLSGEATTAIVLFQPYLDRGDGHDPKRNALNVISVLDNRDKHREPILVVPGLINTTSVITARDERPLVQQFKPPSTGYPGFVENGATVAHARAAMRPPLREDEVKVEVRGTPLVALDVGIKDGYMAVLDTLAGTLGYLWEHVIPVLEQFLPERTP